MRRCMQMRVAVTLLACALVPVTPVLAGQLTATGQTIPFQADKNDGIAGPVAVPDDGTLERGATLRYKVLQDGTVQDMNTGLIWEVKCDCPGSLHHVSNTYVWSGDGTQETIWDWLEDINAEGGAGYAGHDDWRIANLRELQSIVDYELFDPAIDPIFGPTHIFFYWSSTTDATSPSHAWIVYFGGGDVFADAKNGTRPVRAVRGGRK